MNIFKKVEINVHYCNNKSNNEKTNRIKKH